MEWSLMNIGVRVDYSKAKRPHNLPGITGDLPTAARVIKITTEDMTEAMMFRTVTVDLTEEVKEEDGELLKTGIRPTEDSHLLPAVVGRIQITFRAQSYSPHCY